MIDLGTHYVKENRSEVGNDRYRDLIPKNEMQKGIANPECTA